MVGREFAVTADVTVVERKSDRDVDRLNLPDQVTRVRPYPQFARVNYWQPTADNSYTALLLKFEKRMSERYQYLVSYTLSKADDSELQELATATRTATRARQCRPWRIAVIGWCRAASCSCRSGMQLSAIGDLRSSLPFNATTQSI